MAFIPEKLFCIRNVVAGELVKVPQHCDSAFICEDRIHLGARNVADKIANNLNAKFGGKMHAIEYGPDHKRYRKQERNRLTKAE